MISDKDLGGQFPAKIMDTIIRLYYLLLLNFKIYNLYNKN